MITPPAEESRTVECDQTGRFPIVDLSAVIAGRPGSVDRAADKTRAAFDNAAFFFVRNHGVPQALIDGILKECARFHAQPLVNKLEVKMGNDVIGYLPPGSQTQRTSIYNKNTKPEFSAPYYLRRDYPVNHPDRRASAPWVFDNRWPEESTLPGFRKTVSAYFEALDSLTGILLKIFSTLLSMEPQYLGAHPAFSRSNPTLRLLQYQCQDPEEENLFGIGPHSDYGCITILI